MRSRWTSSTPSSATATTTARHPRTLRRRPPRPSEAVASLDRVTSSAPDLPLVARGKVREIYDLGDDLLMVASDRISTYDVVHPTPIPDKGRVLTGLSVLWFDLTEGIVPNHFVSATDGVPEDLRAPALRVQRPRAARPAGADAAGRVRRARVPLGLGVEGLPADGHGLRPRAARGPARVRPAAGAALHA